MISPEILRRYPFFGFMTDAELKAVAMIAEEVSYKEGETLLGKREARQLALLFGRGQRRPSLRRQRSQPHQDAQRISH